MTTIALPATYETLIVGNEPRLFQFDRNVSREEIVSTMTNEGCKPASVADLILFSAKNLNRERNFPIVALGSMASVSHFETFPCLNGNDSIRLLPQGTIFEEKWDPIYRFLGTVK